MNKAVWFVVILIIVIAGAAWIFGGDKDSSNETVQQEQQVTQENPTSSMMENQTSTMTPTSTGEEAMTVKEFTVNGQNFSFDPSTITVKKGDTVKITFKNVSGFHDFKIDEFNAGTQRVNTGGQETIQFVASKSGSFEYYCSVGNHRAMGMKGTLVVQ